MFSRLSFLRRGSIIIRDAEATSSSPLTVNSNKTFLQQLVDDPRNKPTVEGFMNHSITKGWSKTPLEKNPLGAKQFLRFAIMDYHYWRGRFRAKSALMMADNPYEAEDFVKSIANMEVIASSIDRNTKYMKFWLNEVLIPAAKLVNPSCSQQDINDMINKIPQEDFLVIHDYGQKVITYNSDISLWFDAELMSAACLYAWSVRAVEYENDPNTVKEGLYYNTMVLPYLKMTADGKIDRTPDGKAQLNSDAEKISNLIQTSAKTWTWNGQLEEPDRFINMFKQGYLLETRVLDVLKSTK